MHVFADMDLIQAQAASQKYGPVSGSEQDQFQTTSRLNIAQDVTIYAPFDAVMIVQETASPATGMVNVILKPRKFLDLRYPSLKYFIFRGVDRSTIFSGTGSNTEIKAYTSGELDLIKYIWEDYNDLKNEDGFVPNDNGTPTTDILGYQTYQGTDLIEQAFMEDYSESSLFPVLEGWSLGKLKSGGDEPGIEVVLSDAKQLHDFDYARKLTNVVEVIHDPNDVEGDESIAKMSERDKILDHMDPVAWMHSYWYLGVRYKESSSGSNQGLIGKKLKGTDIYNHITSSFTTKNTVYIDIRNHSDYSLNYYKDNTNGNNHLQLGLNQSPVAVSYYTDYWPIYRMDNTDSYQSDFVDLKLSFFTDHNPEPLIYAEHAYISQSIKSETPAPANLHYRFMEPEVLPSGQTEELSFKILGFDDSGTWQSVATHTKLWYLRNQIPDDLPPQTVIPNNTHLDNVFGPVREESRYPFVGAAGGSKWCFGLRKRYIPKPNTGTMVQTGIGFTQGHVIFFAQPVDFNINPVAWKHAFQLLSRSGRKPNIASSNAVKSNVLEAIREMEDYADDKWREVEMTVQSQNRKIAYLPEVMISDSRYDLYGLEEAMYSTIFTENEFDNIVSGIDTAVSNNFIEPDYHDVFLSLDGYQKDGKVGWYLVKATGLNPSGNYALISPTGSNLFTYTVDTFTYTSTDRSAQSSGMPQRDTSYSIFKVREVGGLNDLIDFVTEVEGKYPNTVSSFPGYNYPYDHIKQITTRMRVEYYGVGTKGLAKLAFEWAIKGPLYRYNVLFTGAIHYRLYDSKSEVPVGVERISDVTAGHLKSHADENSIEDNPSPYVIDTDGVRFDLGHAIYGFEGLLWNKETSNFFRRMHVQNNMVSGSEVVMNSLDFAGYIGDIGIAFAEYFYHKMFNSPPLARPYYPLNLDIDRYYDISAPHEDIMGDIESFGWYASYLELKTLFGRDPELTEILKAYYEVDQPLGYDTSVSYKKRFTLFSKSEGFIIEQGGDWMWDTSNLDPGNLNLQSDKYKTLEMRLRNFAFFWFNQSLPVFNELLKVYGLTGVYYEYLLHPNWDDHKSDMSYVISRFLQTIKDGFDNE